MRIDMPKLGAEIVMDMRRVDPEVVVNILKPRSGPRMFPILTMTAREATDLARGLRTALYTLCRDGKLPREETAKLEARKQ